MLDYLKYKSELQNKIKCFFDKQKTAMALKDKVEEYASKQKDFRLIMKEIENPIGDVVAQVVKVDTEIKPVADIPPSVSIQSTPYQSEDIIAKVDLSVQKAKIKLSERSKKIVSRGGTRERKQRANSKNTSYDKKPSQVFSPVKSTKLFNIVQTSK